MLVLRDAKAGVASGDVMIVAVALHEEMRSNTALRREKYENAVWAFAMSLGRPLAVRLAL
jgi:hypothetical protein